MKSVLDVYADMAKDNPKWTPKEEKEFVRKWWRKDREHFVNEAMKHNLGLVFDLVTKKAFSKNEDIVQKCVIAMVEALRKYNPKEGKRISTWIYQPILWAIQQARHPYSRFGSIAEELSALNHKYSTNMRVVSVDARVGTERDSETIGNLISIRDVDPSYVQMKDMKRVDEIANERDYETGVAEMMAELPKMLNKREMFIMRELLAGRTMTDISVELKLSRMRISQISAKAFDKIRKSKVGRKLRELV